MSHTPQRRLPHDHLRDTRLRPPCPSAASLKNGATDVGLPSRALANILGASRFVAMVSSAPEVEALAARMDLAVLIPTVLGAGLRPRGSHGKSSDEPVLDRCMVVVGVPDDVATSRADALIAFVRAVRATGICMRLVNISSIARQPRLANARLLGAHALRRVEPMVAAAVTDYLAEVSGGASTLGVGRARVNVTIQDCIRVVECIDRVGAVVSLAAAGVVSIDRRRPITLPSGSRCRARAGRNVRAAHFLAKFD